MKAVIVAGVTLLALYLADLYKVDSGSGAVELASRLLVALAARPR